MGEGIGELRGVVVEGMRKRKKRKKLVDTDNSVRIAGRRAEKGTRVISGDGRRLDMGE